MKILIGNTGLVGKTIQKYENFDYYFNSSNINDFENIASDEDELFLSCLPATKWLVNKNLSNDMDNMYNIIKPISTKSYSKVVLISTIDVYNDSPIGVDETYSPNISKLSYGNNRYIFELMVREYVKTYDLKIFRLSALFNNLIKKNVLYDLIHNNNVNQINQNSIFQWYNIDNLISDIHKFSNEYPNETIFNLFTEPIHTSDIVELFPHHIDKVQNGLKIMYNYKTKFGGYIDNKDNVLTEIKKLINESSIK
jgi:nucleoside-diphosphate-sugar epimerase